MAVFDKTNYINSVGIVGRVYILLGLGEDG